MLRANELLRKLETKSVDKEKEVSDTLSNHKPSSTHQLQIFDIENKQYDEMAKLMENVDVQAMTPIECMLKLKELEDIFSKA